MKKREITFVAFLLVLLLAISGVYAIDTKIKITTYPDHKLFVDFLEKNPVSLIESFNLNSDSEGEVEFVFSTENSVFDVSVFVFNGGEQICKNKFEDLIPGEPVNFIMYPGNFEIIKNYDELEEENITEEENLTIEVEQEEIVEEEIPIDSVPITGMATSEETGENFLMGNIIYFVVGFLVLVALVFVGSLKLKSIQKTKNYSQEKPQKEIKVKKLSEKLQEMKEDQKDKIGDFQGAIEEAEKKIKDAQKEINKLKNAGKIEELEKRMKEDQEALKKLKDEED